MTTRVFWRLTQWVALAVLYGGAAWCSEWLTFPGGTISPLWAPVGLSVAVLLRYGESFWPGILLGSSAFYIWRRISFPQAGFLAVMDVLEIFVAVALLRRLFDRKFHLAELVDVPKFLLAVLLACLVSALSLLAGTWLQRESVLVWATWLAHVNGMILIAPLFLCWVPLPQKTVGAACLALLGVLGVTGFVFRGWLPRDLGVSFPYLLLPLLLWLASRFNMTTMRLAALSIVAVALLATRSGYGPFVLLASAERLPAVQLFAFMIGLFGLSLDALAISKHAGNAPLQEGNLPSAHALRDQLRASEARWRAILENAPMTITMTDHDGKILALSRPFLPGTQVDELIGTNFYTYLPPENRMRALEVSAAVIQSGQPTSFDMAFSHPDGGRHWVSHHMAPVIQEGDLVTLIHLTIDITERKIAEQALRANEKRLRTIIDAAPFGAHSYDLFADGQLIFSGYNLAADQILGFSHASIIGKSIEEAFPGLIATPLPDIYRRVAAEGERYHDEQIAYQGGQIQGVFEIHAFQTIPHHMTVFFRDITERKKADERIQQMTVELEQRVRQRTAELEATNRKLETINLELESLSYTVSHDLRSPLRAIDGFSHILMDEYADQLPEEALRRMKAIRSNAQQMGQLIDDLLTFVHLGRQSLVLRQVNMQALVEQALIALEDELSTRKIEVIFGTLPLCTGDPSLLRQVWLNLISNAVKFTRHRHLAKIEITSEQRDSETVYWVRDNGTGFNMQYADKLFGMFQRLHVQEQYEGTGVGLAIVERIIHKHGGRIWAEARPDEGATFYFVVS